MKSPTKQPRPRDRLIERMTPTRRTFLKTLGAGLVIAVVDPLSFSQNAQRGRNRGGGGAANILARIHIGNDGTITVMTGKVECGQGARAEISQAAAEELRVAVDRIDLVMADTSLVPDDGGTFGSQTTPRTLPAIRQGAAAARDVLISLACQKWGVAASEVEVRDGTVIHAASKREVTYAELAGDEITKAFAARPGNVEVTPVKQWKVMGTAVSRPNGRDIVTGAHHYPSGIVRPKMLYGKVLRAPFFGATLTTIDLAPAKAMADVVVVQDGNFVGVAAPTSFRARAALDALEKAAVWESKPQISSDQLYDHLLPKDNSEFGDAPAKGDKTVRQVYHVAYVQHAPLEPRAAVAEWQDGKLTVWTGTQNPFSVRSELARAMNLEPDAVRVIVPDFGGGFGGKHTGEAAVEAARLAKAAGRPVQLVWTRTEEFTWAYFRPAGVLMTQASLTSDGSIASWSFVNILSGPSGLESPYRGKKIRQDFVEATGPLRQGSYRGLAATANHFARESFIDELAASVGANPLEFRLANLDDSRLGDVLKAAADKFDFLNRWKNKTPGVGVGISCGTEKGSYVAACAEVSIDATRAIAVKHVCQAFECGKIVNPTGLMSQVQGAIMMGIGPALREAMQFENGRITNASFGKYLVPRFADLPRMDVVLVDRPDIASAGAGETPIVAIAPAIGNAVYHATGIRVREMPIKLPPGLKN